MKKKVLLVGLLAIICVGVFGCGKNTQNYVTENMSEWTKIYFEGEGDGFHASLSFGEREKAYLVDGKSGENVDFALLTLFTQQQDDAVVKVQVCIDEDRQEHELELTMNGQYMVDLERTLTGNENIYITFEGQEVEMKNLSNSFEIDDEKAIEIASGELKEQIKLCKNGSKLGAECYLRILDKKINDFDVIYWCFSVVNERGESFSILISTQDGSVLAK